MSSIVEVSSEFTCGPRRQPVRVSTYVDYGIATDLRQVNDAPQRRGHCGLDASIRLGNSCLRFALERTWPAELSPRIESLGERFVALQRIPLFRVESMFQSSARSQDL